MVTLRLSTVHPMNHPLCILCVSSIHLFFLHSSSMHSLFIRHLHPVQVETGEHGDRMVASRLSTVCPLWIPSASTVHSPCILQSSSIYPLCRSTHPIQLHSSSVHSPCILYPSSIHPLFILYVSLCSSSGQKKLRLGTAR
jgi:hypothetical protein